MGANDKHLRNAGREGWNSNPTEQQRLAKKEETTYELLEEFDPFEEPNPGKPRSEEQKKINRLQQEIRQLKREVQTWKGRADYWMKHWGKSYHLPGYNNAQPAVQQQLDKIKETWEKFLKCH